MAQAIYIPSQRRHFSLGAFAAMVKRVKAAPVGAIFPCGFFDLGPCSRETILAEFRTMVMRQVNIRGGHAEWSDSLPAGLVRDARRVVEIKQHRIRHYQFESKQVRSRLAHLLSSYND